MQIMNINNTLMMRRYLKAIKIETFIHSEQYKFVTI